MKTYKIAVVPGDGIGPEVTDEAIKVLRVAAETFGFKVDLTDFDFGGERYMRTGETLPDSSIEELKQFQAIFLGAIGHPDIKPGILEKGILLKARFALDQYINLRPIRLYPGVPTPLKDKGPEDIDYVVVRENTGGLYTGTGGVTMKGTPSEVAVQSMVYSRFQVERCIRFAFEYLKKQHTGNPWRGLTDEEKKKGLIGKLTLCGKTNVLTYVFDLWQRVFDEVAQDLPMIKTDYCHVDAICIYMIEDPGRFNGIVTNNMFGDIITDLAAVTQGGMGVAPSGNLNPQGVSMFEPIHGTAPSFAGQGVVNPLAAICAAQMMVKALGEEAAATKIEEAVKVVTGTKLKSLLVGQMGYSTSQVGDLVTDLVTG